MFPSGGEIAERAGDQGDLRYQGLNGPLPRHLQHEAPCATSQETNRLHKAYMNHRTDLNKAAFFRYRRIVQQRLVKKQDAWMTREIEEIQGYVDRNDTKAVYTPPPSQRSRTASRLRWNDASDGKTTNSEALGEHCRSVLNRPSTTSAVTIDRPPK
ncbi:hypothetical protein SprV_0100186000 [Sparganum proliferum]